MAGWDFFWGSEANAGYVGLSMEAEAVEIDTSLAWPVGSVFIAVVSTNPATLLGFGTWTAFGAGKVLVGRDGGDVDFDTVEETGGSKLVSVDVPSTNTSGPTSTTKVFAGGVAVASSTHIHAVDPDPVTISIVQPYIVVYMWKRTA